MSEMNGGGRIYSLHTPEEMAATLASKLKARRLDRGWKQETLATRSGVSLASLRRLESTGQGSMKNFLRLVFALGYLDEMSALLEPPAARSIAEYERLHQRPKRQRGRL